MNTLTGVTEALHENFQCWKVVGAQREQSVY